jgi:hypothetical protein
VDRQLNLCELKSLNIIYSVFLFSNYREKMPHMPPLKRNSLELFFDLVLCLLFVCIIDLLQFSYHSVTTHKQCSESKESSLTV